MNIILFISFFILAVILIFIILGFVRTWQIMHNKEQINFLKGKLPDPAPNGFYKGFAKVNTGPWIGKSFAKDQNTGINVFQAGAKRIERFPFKTLVGKGLLDKNIDVLKIEYNLPKNSFLLRKILDEIVEVEPGKYMGKAHIRLIPKFPFTVGYFYLNA